MPAKILVSYKTRLVPNYTPDASGIKAPSNYKDQAKINAYISDATADLAVQALYQPYTATFDEVHMVDLAHEKPGRWVYRDPAKPDSGLPVCLRVRAWLLQQYPDAWSNSTHPAERGAPVAIFVGFDPRLFLKILGNECSLPSNQPVLAGGKPDPNKTNCLPLAMWHGNSDHRDIVEAVKPAEFKFLTWNTVLASRGLADRFKGWKEPHLDAKLDIELITELAAQVGMLSPD